MKHLYLLITLLMASAQMQAQSHRVYSPHIASLQVVADGNWLSLPVTEVGGDISIDFDDLTHEHHRYTYTVRHCEADWTYSDQLFASDYIEGFADGNTIDDSEESVNTTVLYTHYSISLPNGKCRIKMSGNYELTVYDEDNDHEPLLKACFMLYEPLAGVGLAASTNTDVDINGSHQQVAMEVTLGNVHVTNPAQQIKTVVMQNGQWLDARVNATPQYIMPDGMRWEHNRDLIFDAGNEYRKFEMLDVNHTTMGLEAIDWDGERYHAHVFEDDPRPHYVHDVDADGAFVVRNSDNMAINTTCDYLVVHFYLKAPQLPGDVFVNGAWTNNELSPAYQLTYNAELQRYEGELELKQGYYSYQYLLRRPDGTIARVPTEGSFYQTENRYQALVYYRGTGERTDRLIGYNEIVANQK